MASSIQLLTLAFLGLTTALTPSSVTETHPKLQTWKCTLAGGCVSQNTALVMDELFHPIHQTNSILPCATASNTLNSTVCPDAVTCAKNCAVDGISDYTKYGVFANGSSVEMHQVNPHGSVVSPRLYLLGERGEEYEMLKLTGQELSFDVDASALPCGMNGALYLSQMAADGGKSALNAAGAKYGSGYCDAQCHDIPVINGVANIEGKGSCCNEMDIWEANKVATSISPHTCNKTGPYSCSGAECNVDGVCAQKGCSYNPYGLGNHNYYGPGLQVNTNRPVTVVTQFLADASGTLKSIERLYIQDGKIIQDASLNFTGTAKGKSISDEFCTGRAGRFMDLGGVEGMGRALERGMVLSFSVWWDNGGNMTWLDSGSAGPCNITEGTPSTITKVEPDPRVTFSQIKWGEIGSTYITNCLDIIPVWSGDRAGEAGHTSPARGLVREGTQTRV